MTDAATGAYPCARGKNTTLVCKLSSGSDRKKVAGKESKLQAPTAEDAARHRAMDGVFFGVNFWLTYGRE